MSRRVVVLTEIISPYRIPVFNALTRSPKLDLHVIFLAENDPTLRQWKVYKNEIRFSYEVLPSWRRRLRDYNLLLNWRVQAALRQASPQAVMCGGYSYMASWITLIWSKRRGIPFTSWIESTLRDQRSGRYLTEQLKAKFLENCNAFVVPGKASFDYLQSYGVLPQTIFTAPNAVDVGLFSRQSDAVRANAAIVRRKRGLPERFFLFVGRLVHEKGVFDFIQAFRRLKPSLRNGVGLVIVGDGPARKQLQQRAAGEAAIRFVGFLQRDELAAYYALADALVFPTHTDTWGLVVNEAMACGVPIIASSVAGCTADLVRDDWNGRLIEPGNIGQLADAMSALASDPELRACMGERSRNIIAAYTPEACAAGIAQALTSGCRA